MADTKQKLLGVGIWLALLLVIFSISYFPLTSNKVVSAPFLNDAKLKKAVVFFGFTHCGDVCPTTLGVLRDMVNQVDAGTPLAEVVFVDIDKSSNLSNAQTYAHQFHPSFVGYIPSTTELAILTQDFGLNIRQQGNDIQHMGRTYLLVKQQQNWRLVKSYNPLKITREALYQAIIELG